MNTEHPITPPPELVTSLRNSAPHGIRDAGVTRELWLINHAYAAGANQELEACCEWVRSMFGGHPTWADELLAARRPKPPSLKEEALAALTQYMTGETILAKDSVDTIRRALEVSMPDPDYKALCAELVKAWDGTADFDFNDFGHAAADIVGRARAALARWGAPANNTREEN